MTEQTPSDDRWEPTPGEAPRRRRRALVTGGVLATAAALAVAGGVVGRVTAGSGGTGPSAGQGRAAAPWRGGISPWDHGRGGSSYASPPSGTIARATAAQLGGMVRIVAVSDYQGSTAAGTGMLLTGDGEVVTNNHVVQGATRIRATVMSTGQSYTARLLGTDVQDDVAVLRLTGASGLRPVTTDSAGVTTGESVTAVGDAGGATGHLSAVNGTVTALHRSITTHSEDGSGSERLHGLIQLAADVVSGDSGGAVLGSTGRVVGMTTAASSGPGAVTGYAIPISAVLGVVDQVDTGTGSARVGIGYDAFLGIELPQGSATTVAGVIPGTPAARLGLADADTVTAVDGRRVPTASALRRAIAAHRPGDRVTVRWTDPAGVAHSGSVRLTRGPVA